MKNINVTQIVYNFLSSLGMIDDLRHCDTPILDTNMSSLMFFQIRLANSIILVDQSFLADDLILSRGKIMPFSG